jgi:sulfur-carrier protein
MPWKPPSLRERAGMNVLIPSALRSYTESSVAQASGATLAELLDDLDRRYPGIRFRMIDEQDRIRRHIRVFVNGGQVTSITHTLSASDDIVIVQALSGG